MYNTKLLSAPWMSYGCSKCFEKIYLTQCPFKDRHKTYRACTKDSQKKPETCPLKSATQMISDLLNRAVSLRINPTTVAAR